MSSHFVDEQEGWLELLYASTYTQCASGIELTSLPSLRSHGIFDTVFKLTFASWDIQYMIANGNYYINIGRTPQIVPFYMLGQSDPIRTKQSYTCATDIGERLLERLVLAGIDLAQRRMGYNISLIHLARINWNEA